MYSLLRVLVCFSTLLFRCRLSAVTTFCRGSGSVLLFPPELVNSNLQADELILIFPEFCADSQWPLLRDLEPSALNSETRGDRPPFQALPHLYLFILTAPTPVPQNAAAELSLKLSGACRALLTSGRCVPGCGATPGCTDDGNIKSPGVPGCAQSPGPRTRLPAAGGSSPVRSLLGASSPPPALPRVALCQSKYLRIKK